MSTTLDRSPTERISMTVAWQVAEGSESLHQYRSEGPSSIRGALGLPRVFVNCSRTSESLLGLNSYVMLDIAPLSRKTSTFSSSFREKLHSTSLADAPLGMAQFPSAWNPSVDIRLTTVSLDSPPWKPTPSIFGCCTGLGSAACCTGLGCTAPTACDWAAGFELQLAKSRVERTPIRIVQFLSFLPTAPPSHGFRNCDNDGQMVVVHLNSITERDRRLITSVTDRRTRRGSYQWHTGGGLRQLCPCYCSSYWNLNGRGWPLLENFLLLFLDFARTANQKPYGPCVLVAYQEVRFYVLVFVV